MKNSIKTKKQNPLIQFFKYFSTFMTLVLILQLILQEFALFSILSVSASWEAIYNFFWIFALGCDIYFTLDFFVRLISARIHKKERHYWIQEGGWIDFLTSIPMLLFISLPFFIMQFIDEPWPIDKNPMAIVETIALFRFLKFLKLTKLFSKKTSHMTTRHIKRLYITGILAFTLFAVFCGTFINIGLLYLLPSIDGEFLYLQGGFILFQLPINLIIILCSLGSLLFLKIYATHFTKTVVNPIMAMKNGFEIKDYTRMAAIPEKYKEDEIFLLANAFNNRWLPAKLRKLQNSSEVKVTLKSEDILKKISPTD